MTCTVSYPENVIICKNNVEKSLTGKQRDLWKYCIERNAFVAKAVWCPIITSEGLWQFHQMEIRESSRHSTTLGAALA